MTDHVIFDEEKPMRLIAEKRIGRGSANVNRFTRRGMPQAERKCTTGVQAQCELERRMGFVGGRLCSCSWRREFYPGGRDYTSSINLISILA